MTTHILTLPQVDTLEPETTTPIATQPKPKRVAKKRRKLGKNQRKEVLDWIQRHLDYIPELDANIELAVLENCWDIVDAELDKRIESMKALDWCYMRLAD